MALKVGVTGGIGSGKSTVCRVFECLGVPVYYADDRARWLTENHVEIVAEVTALLGPEAYTHDGGYNTAFVSSRVFGDKSLLQRLNQIIHPRVGEDSRRWFEQHADQPILMKEAAIMKKQGSELDYIVAVIAPEQLRISRVLTRDKKRTKEQIMAIIANQGTDEYFRSIADFIVYNNESELIIPQVVEIYNTLLASASGSN